MNNFQKICMLGTQPGLGRLFVTINFKDGRLAITGVEGPRGSGNASGGCGQIVMHEWDINKYGKGWDAEKVAKLREIWNRWHLNTVHAGSPTQEAWLRDNPTFNTYETRFDALRAAGINPDPNYLHNGKPYEYGSAWLKEEVPEEVLLWLQSLPDSQFPHPWKKSKSS